MTASDSNQQLKLHLHYDSSSPPTASLFCLSLPREKKAANVETSADQNKPLPRVEFTLAGKTVANEADDLQLAQLICLSLPNTRVLIDSPPENYTSGTSSDFQSSVTHWIDLASHLDASIVSAISSNKPAVAVSTKSLTEIDNYLRVRTFLVGHQLSLADIALYSVIAKLFGFNNLTSSSEVIGLSSLVNMRRWLLLVNSMNSISPKVLKTINAAYPGHAAKPVARSPVNAEKKQQEQNNELNNNKKCLFEGKLPGAVKGKVVVRFSPEPSGYLHIGHAKAALLNAYFARLYEGKLLVRFDDTNPSKEKMEYEQSIIEDLRLLDINTDTVSHTSDYFEQIEEHCERLLKEGVFYCDDTPVEQMRFERGEGIESKCRNHSIEENLRRWEEMKKGSEEGLKNCVRAKIDMQSKNKCMRDPVMYRCNVSVPHHIHGRKYKAYPVYDFACPIVDTLEGISHAMRANEYADRIPQYQWVLNACKFPPIIIYEFSRMNLVNTVLSKRKLQWLVDHGAVESWEDPRFPTVRGIRRRGMTPQALMDFILEQGASKNVNLMEWDKIWAKNKQVIDPIVPRYMSVDAQAIPVILSNGPETPETKERDLHPKNSELGKGVQIYGRELLIEREDAEMMEDNEEITLMRWCNAIIESIQKNPDGSIKSIAMKLHPDGDFKKTKKKIHWISASAPLTPSKVILREFDHIISKKKPEDDDQIEDIYNKDSIQNTEALADPAVASLKAGDMLQFERRGYFILDQPATDTTPAVFIKIPDGKSKAMSVIQTKVAADKLAKGQ